jgi:hypothetical protein
MTFSDDGTIFTSYQCLMNPTNFTWYGLTISSGYFFYDLFLCLFFM